MRYERNSTRKYIGESISSIDKIDNNDYVIVVVELNASFTDKHGKDHETGAHVVDSSVEFIPASYFSSPTKNKGRKTLEHENFHLFGLDDIEDYEDSSNLMFHLDGKTGYELTDEQIGLAFQWLLDFPSVNNLLQSSSHASKEKGTKETLLDRLENNNSEYDINEEKAKKAGIN